MWGFLCSDPHHDIFCLFQVPLSEKDTDSSRIKAEGKEVGDMSYQLHKGGLVDVGSLGKCIEEVLLHAYFYKNLYC